MSTTRLPHGLLAALSVLSCAALLQGCADPQADADPRESAVPSVAETTEASEPAEEPAEPSGTDCLTGSWELQNESLEAAMTAMLQNSPEVPADMKADMRIELTGGSFIRFSGTDVFTAWQDAFTMTMSARGGRVQYVNESDDAGSYAASDDSVWIYDMVMLFTSTEMLIDGVGSVELDSSNPGMASIDFFGYTDTVPGADLDLVDGVANYTCIGDELVLESDGGVTAAFSRFASE